MSVVSVPLSDYEARLVRKLLDVHTIELEIQQAQDRLNQVKGVPYARPSLDQQLERQTCKALSSRYAEQIELWAAGKILE